MLESYLDTKFEWVTITDQLARETLHELLRFLDEPLENPIHVGTYLMSKRAKEIGLKSVLTGDGSDEFFLGYERHGVWYNHPDPKSAYPTLHWTLKPGEVEQLYAPDNDFIFHNMVNGDGLDIEPFLNMDQSLLYERGERLPEYHNMRLDRMTMAHGIEAKVPFLDHRIVEYSLNLPAKLLFGSDGKDWLKQVAAKWLPEKLIHREKVLFPSLPDQWLLGKGAEWAADILLDPSAKIYRYLRRNTMEKYISEHKHREVLRGKQLWALISLELWLKQIESWEKDRAKEEIAYS
ncbi:asparagine synthetase B (glutamine-hydrolyzing) [Fontibacillus solani]|uniref:asparagine synthase (glutamine-hydrolyzing) n=1 Tax=Fontibacillus solani TaxID=1572857 RepID=A0A7W3SYP5_9BACL|nr:asparagine synthetase B (glutamine-hydrolyzing) [Fontibacillus solani]